MDINTIIQSMDGLLESSKSVPFSGGKKSIDTDEMHDLLDELKQNVPDEIKQSKLVLEREAYILEDAKRNAGLIVNEAEEKAKQMVEEHEIVMRANDRAEEIMENARGNAREIREGAMNYASDMLRDLEMKLQQQLNVIKVNLSEFENDGPSQPQLPDDE